jgi:hypothetical protein
MRRTPRTPFLVHVFSSHVYVRTRRRKRLEARVALHTGCRNILWARVPLRTGFRKLSLDVSRDQGQKRAATCGPSLTQPPELCYGFGARRDPRERSGHRGSAMQEWRRPIRTLVRLVPRPFGPDAAAGIVTSRTGGGGWKRALGALGGHSRPRRSVFGTSAVHGTSVPAALVSLRTCSQRWRRPESPWGDHGRNGTTRRCPIPGTVRIVPRRSCIAGPQAPDPFRGVPPCQSAKERSGPRGRRARRPRGPFLQWGRRPMATRRPMVPPLA